MTWPDTEEWIVFAQGEVHCPECPDKIPIPVLARMEIDSEGNQNMNSRLDLSEVWAHSWTHDKERGNGTHQVGGDAAPI